MIVFKLMVLPFPMVSISINIFIDRPLIKHTWRPIHDETTLCNEWVSWIEDVLRHHYLPRNT